MSFVCTKCHLTTEGEPEPDGKCWACAGKQNPSVTTSKLTVKTLQGVPIVGYKAAIELVDILGQPVSLEEVRKIYGVYKPIPIGNLLGDGSVKLPHKTILTSTQVPEDKLVLIVETINRRFKETGDGIVIVAEYYPEDVIGFAYDARIEQIPDSNDKAIYVTPIARSLKHVEIFYKNLKCSVEYWPDQNDISTMTLLS